MGRRRVECLTVAGPEPRSPKTESLTVRPNVFPPREPTVVGPRSCWSPGDGSLIPMGYAPDS
jgi:hypothetical protein